MERRLNRAFARGPGLPGRAALLIALVGASVGVMPAAFGGGGRPGKTKVVCTTTMITDLARAIAGDDAEVRGIMKPGEDPHVYDVRPRDAQMIAAADLVLANGLHLESTLQHTIENNATQTQVVLLAETPKIKPLGSEQFVGAPDPHCWFNVSYFSVYAERTRDALIAVDPAHAEGYKRRADAYLRKLGALHEWVRTQIAAIPRKQRALVSSHDAFQYFGAAYDIDVFAVIGISTEQQPKPRDIARLESIVRERNIKAVFVETSVSQSLNNLIRKIASATGARIGGKLYSDSLGLSGTEASTYLGMIRYDVRTIVEALK